MPFGPLVGHWQQSGGTFTMHINEKLGNFPLPNPWEQAWPPTTHQPVPMVHNLVKALHNMLRAIGKPLIAGSKAPPPSVQGVGGVGITRRRRNDELLVTVNSALAKKSFLGTTPWCSHSESKCVNCGSTECACSAWCITPHSLWAFVLLSEYVPYMPTKTPVCA